MALSETPPRMAQEEQGDWMQGDCVNGLAICSGIGGLEIGVGRALYQLAISYHCVCHIERECFAAAVLTTQMEKGNLDQAPIWDDLTTFDGKPWRGIVDLITIGAPCQPFSVAGKRKAFDDERASEVWPQIFRIIGEVRPALVFIENVPGLLQFFRPIGEELCGMGFELEAGLFSAAEVGASHKRERLFILAYSTSNDRGHGSQRSSVTKNQGRIGIGTRCWGLQVGDNGCALENPARDGGNGSHGETGSRRGVCETGNTVADAENDNGRRGISGEETGTGAERIGRRGLAGCGGTVGNASIGESDERRSRSLEQEEGERECFDTASVHAGEYVGDAFQSRLEGYGWNGTGCLRQEREISQQDRPVTEASIPPFPPGPSDTEAWARILAVRPDLAPAVECSVRRVPSKLFNRMDGDLNAKPKETSTGQPLQELREVDGEKTEYEYEAASCEGLLQSTLHGNGNDERKSNSQGIWVSCAETKERLLRTLQYKREPFDSSHRQGLEEQRTFKYSDAVQFLSYLLAPPEQRYSPEITRKAVHHLRKNFEQDNVPYMQNEIEAQWQSLYQEDKERIFLDAYMDWLGENRVDRLRCLGNAVVPACAERAFRTLWEQFNC